MPEAALLVLAAVGGGAVGLMFFGGLCWTVRRAMASAHAALWFLASGVLRMGMALAGFYLVGHGHWDRMAACLIGFTLARMAVLRLTRPGVDPAPLPIRNRADASHA